MRNCIVQFHIPAETFDNPSYNNIGVNDKILPLSLKSVQQYANKCNVDYKLVQDKRINWIHPTFERFDLFFNDDWFGEYDNILYLDTDLVVWPEAPNIFDLYPSINLFKVCKDRIAERINENTHKAKVKNTALDCFSGEQLRYNRFNAGVFMLNKNSVSIMKEYLDYKNIELDDNELLIYAMLKSNVPVEKMDWRFNKKNGTSCYFGHAYGQQKFKLENYDFLEKAKKIYA